MSFDLNLRCRCGKLRGRLRDAGPARGQRMRCYCRDCQSYAHHLGQAESVLDEHGGTGLFQTTPDGLEITTGEEQLACLRLSPKGPLRWYARCCNTPLANTLSEPKLPFVALLQASWDGDPGDRLGPETGIMAGDARGDRSQLDAYARVPLTITLRVVARLLRARLKGAHKQSPFFHAASGRPRSEPHILSRGERAQALAQAGFG